MFLQELCLEQDFEQEIEQISFDIDQEKLRLFLTKAPPMLGGEYLSLEFLQDLMAEIKESVFSEAKEKGIRSYLRENFPNWLQLGHVYFHLAENKNNVHKPFAFLATYSSKQSEGRVRHLPLGQALKHYSSANKKVLLNMLQPVQKASFESSLVKELVESGQIYKPVPWSPNEAHRFLMDIPKFEENGIIVRVPLWWNKKAPPRAKVQVRVGDRLKHHINVDALLNFDVSLSIGAEKVSKEDWQKLLESNERLVFLNGKWVEVDQKAIQSSLDHWHTIMTHAHEEGISFTEAMRLLSRANITKNDQTLALDHDWTDFVAGKEILKFLDQVHDPRLGKDLDLLLKKDLQATLRPYQKKGVAWLYCLYQLSLGGCLADDMGLGKTIQILSLLLLIKKRHNAPLSLLVLPTSLMSNWLAELRKFAPSLKVVVFHSSSDQKIPKKADELQEYDLAMTTYGSVRRFDLLRKVSWDMIILDEAQAIKNSVAMQTKAIKALSARVRFVLTGTPIENRLEDLWSLFDFACPSLLGSRVEFASFTSALSKNEMRDYTPLRKLIQPYVLRRLKTDQTIIKDLPAKIERETYCYLTKHQASLYQSSVDEFFKLLDSDLSGMKRKGLILAFLMRFKQICNHPSQYLADGGYELEKSGKIKRLLEICEEINERQEKVLVFTQFREITDILDRYLSETFGQKGYVLHGGTTPKKRAKMVESFQKEEGGPYFVLSLKAGGTGLNLTQANHVIHFDRWWNPAVENQATDRAYRIGQKKNTLVHKMVCKGTIEEKISHIIREKSELAEKIIEGGEEIRFSELSNDEIMDLVKLDLKAIALDS